MSRRVDWGPVAARVLLGLVFAWFGYHELWQPRLWTGYVPAVSSTSGLAVWAVLAHGFLLLIVAAALLFGSAPRLASWVGVIVMAEVVLSLVILHGLSDITVRDVGVLGLALALATQRRHPLALTR